MTVKEAICELSKMPGDMHLLVNENGSYTEFQKSDIRYVHKSKLENDTARRVRSLIKSDFDYIGLVNVR